MELGRCRPTRKRPERKRMFGYITPSTSPWSWRIHARCSPMPKANRPRTRALSHVGYCRRALCINAATHFPNASKAAASIYGTPSRDRPVRQSPLPERDKIRTLLRLRRPDIYSHDGDHRESETRDDCQRRHAMSRSSRPPITVLRFEAAGFPPRRPPSALGTLLALSRRNLG